MLLLFPLDPYSTFDDGMWSDRKLSDSRDKRVGRVDCDSDSEQELGHHVQQRRYHTGAHATS